MENYIEQAKDILSASLLIPIETIDGDADISAIGEIDSLSFELIMVELERRSGKPVDPVTVLEMKSVRDIAEVLRKAGS